MCESEEFTTCKKCKENFELIDGSCPCKDENCVLCDTGLKNASCFLCKKSYNRKKKCIFESRFDNCYECKEDHCLVWNPNYYFNYTQKKCLLKETSSTVKKNCNVIYFVKNALLINQMNVINARSLI